MDQQKPAWWSTLPGVLTAATGFVAAMTGLVAGLNQLGVFRRDEPPRQEVSAAAPAETVLVEPEEHTATPTEPAPVEAAPPAAAPEPRAAPTPASVPEPETPTPAPGPDTAPAEPPSTERPDTERPAARGRVLPSGTVLELIVAGRVCAPESGHRRFTARLAAPVALSADTLPVGGTTAVLRLRQRSSPPGFVVRLDSLTHQGQAAAVRRAEVGVRRPGSAGCIPAGAPMTAVLQAPVTLPSR